MEEPKKTLLFPPHARFFDGESPDYNGTLTSDIRHLAPCGAGPFHRDERSRLGNKDIIRGVHELLKSDGLTCEDCIVYFTGMLLRGIE